VSLQAKLDAFNADLAGKPAYNVSPSVVETMHPNERHRVATTIGLVEGCALRGSERHESSSSTMFAGKLRPCSTASGDRADVIGLRLVLAMAHLLGGRLTPEFGSVPWR
jgi:hypothetical protein